MAVEGGWRAGPVGGVVGLVLGVINDGATRTVIAGVIDFESDVIRVAGPGEAGLGGVGVASGGHITGGVRVADGTVGAWGFTCECASGAGGSRNTRTTAARRSTFD